MSFRRRRQWVAVVLASTLTAVGAFVPLAADESHPSNYLFATPVFGIDTAFDGSFLVADAGRASCDYGATGARSSRSCRA